MGPAHWGSLDQAFAACACGSEQSPIDLSGLLADDYPAVAFDYDPRSCTLLNDGHNILVNVDRGSGIILDGTRFELIQFHFHHAGEHTVNSTRWPMEMHLVHRNHHGALAVVGIFITAGSGNEALAPLWERLPPRPAPAVAVPVAVDVAALLPGRRTAWRYRGSLTTPPCTEGVSWVVMSDPVTLSAAQIATFAAIYSNNYRPVQPRNLRFLSRGGRSYT